MEILKRFNGRRFVFLFSVIGPGLITAAVDNDAGGIATYSIAGANFGYGMLWAVIPITFLLVIVQEMCARMGVVTGKGLADLIRENFGLRITLFLMIGLLFANFFVTISEFAGIAAAAGLFGLSRYIALPVCVVFVLFTVLKFNYKSLEKFFLLMIFFYLSYIISGFLSNPDWGDVVKETFIPSFSLTAPYLILLVGVVGTTITPWMQFYLQSSVVEKGLGLKDYVYSRAEVVLGCILTDFVSFFIIVVCGTVLYANGIGIETAADAARALQPLAGEYAFILFAVGFFGAALFGAFILPISTSFYVCEALGWESGVNKTFSEAREFYMILILLTVAAAGTVLIPDMPLIPLIVAAQVVNGILLPFILIPILLLVNNRKLMGDHVNPPWLNVVAWAASILLILTSLLMVVTTVIDIQSAGFF
jgi:NRAMP (natural resistance-associated macrophage protein)-like metal ion transporter